MNDSQPRYTLRVNRIVLNKLAYIAKYNGRTKNKEIEWLIRQHIQAFEAEHGTITKNLILDVEKNVEKEESAG